MMNIEVEEAKFLDYIQQKKLVNEESLTFCLKEQKRLSRMGYDLQLSAVLYGAKILKLEEIEAIYKAISGEVQEEPLARLMGTIPFAEMALPRVHQKKKPKKSKPPVEMKEKIDELVKSLEKKKKSKKAKPSLDELLDEMEEIVELEEIAEGRDEEMAKTKTTQTKDSFSGMDPASILASLQEMLGKIGLVSPPASESETISSPKPVHRIEEEGEEVECNQTEKVQISAEKALRSLQKGAALDGYHIVGLSLAGTKFDKAVSLTNCSIENLDLSDAEFLEAVDFDGTCFSGKAIWKGSIFQKDVQFKKAVFLDGADFTQTQFKGDVRFHTTIFKRYVSFNRSQFAQKAIFSRAVFEKGAKFNEVEFVGASSFNDLHCDHRFYMNNCKFGDESTFSNSQFADIADFARSEFAKVVKFKGTNFMKWASFQNVKFQDECHFNGANASEDLSFGWASFASLINLSTLCAERNVNFKNAQIGPKASFRFLDAYFGRLFISPEQIKNHLESHIEEDYKVAAQEYGLLKNNFREINEYDEEDWAYLWEKRMGRFSIKVTNVRTALSRFFNWLALDLACGYGTKPFNIFLTALTALLSFALFYFILGYHFVVPQGGDPNQAIPLMDAIQVSFRTFTNSSIGGWEVRPTSWVNYLMMFESFFGFFTMTVLVVTFSRKVIR